MRSSTVHDPSGAIQTIALAQTTKANSMQFDANISIATLQVRAGDKAGALRTLEAIKASADTHAGGLPLTNEQIAIWARCLSGAGGEAEALKLLQSVDSVSQRGANVGRHRHG